MTEYIVLTTGRTASELMMSMLNQPDHIQASSEIYLNKCRLSRQQVDNTLNIILQKANGKDIAYKINGDEIEEHQEYLINRPNVKVIFLYRRSVFDMALSACLSKITGKWAGYARLVQPGTIVPPENIESWIQGLRRQMDNYRKLVKATKNPVLVVTYPEYIKDQESLLEFIGWDKPLLVPTGLDTAIKQSSPALHAKIGNYEQLKERFGGEVWELG